MIKPSRLTSIIKRYKTTVRSVSPDDNVTIKRPTPILLLRIRQEKEDEWSSLWQREFSQLGYHSVDASIELSTNEKDALTKLQLGYKDLTQVTSNLSFFPPLLISKGNTAWSIAQKYVSNKPVSGLILIDGEQDMAQLPHSQFEPHFPILHVNTNQSSKLPSFLEGWIDQVKGTRKNEFKNVIDWMNDIGM